MPSRREGQASCELLSLGRPTDRNSDWAQGGIIYDTNPDPLVLDADIMEAGDHMSNPAAGRATGPRRPAIVRQVLIDDAGVDFDRDGAGRLDFTREGGHAERRIIHSKDATGTRY